MSQYTIEIQNYRSIPHGRPLNLEISDGITFILGINNAGKTNLLKLFYELRPLFQAIIEGHGRGNYQLQVNFDAMANRECLEHPIQLRVTHDSACCELTVSPPANPHASVCPLTVTTSGFGRGDTTAQEIGKFFRSAMCIPPVRSLTRGVSAPTSDVRIGTDFVRSWDEWANGEDIQARKKIAGLKRELKELFQFNHFELQVSNDRQSLLITNDDGTFRIDELGDGISHFIAVLGNVLLKQPSFLLIDEPENGLHPKMQELFIRALAAKSQRGLIATSHSIGLARSVADRIFSLTRNPVEGPKFSPFGEHHIPTISQSLSELGYSQFVEIGGNNLLLVEGRTDIKSFREILRKYGLDQHFLIWSLGGGEFIVQDATKIADELNELRRLNPKSISVVFDSEKTSNTMHFDPRFEVFSKVCSKIGFKVFATEFHSTENYITQAAIDAVIGSKFKALQPFEKLGASAPAWDKNKNWLMFREMKVEDFKDTQLDKFITGVLKPLVSA
jgi:ABC-type cobalamin/Fe3+-siderophores transport system ATPase subunit